MTMTTYPARADAARPSPAPSPAPGLPPQAGAGAVANGVGLLMIGAPGTEMRIAAAMAREAGADVAMADTPDRGLAALRTSYCTLVMIDVDTDVATFLARLRRERFAVPVLACGIDAPAERAVAAIRAGACDYLPMPPQRDLIAAALTIAAAAPDGSVVGRAPGFLRAAAAIAAVAGTPTALLVLGEHGSGKAHVARASCAACSPYRPLLSVGCADATAELLDAELFGYAAGAIDGVGTRRIGRIEQARGGTLLLSNVDRLALPLQSRLAARLRAMPDVATVATGAHDLPDRVAAGTFDRDLYAQLAKAVVEMPPLRERPGDAALLAAHLARQFNPAGSLDPDALAMLDRYSWPGNVDELADVVRRALVLSHGAPIAPADLVLANGERLTTVANVEVANLVGRTVEEVERALILRTLERCHGNRTSASGILGISVRTMRNKLKSFIEAGIAVAPPL